MTDFIEFNELDMKQNFNMTEPHSHGHYEFYFLLEGEREFFMKDRILNVGPDTLIIIPPFLIHKTEGGPYKRVNVNISGKYFSEYEKKIISDIIDKGVVKLDDRHSAALFHLLSEGAKADAGNDPNAKEIMACLLHAIVMLLGRSELTPLNGTSVSALSDCSVNILKVVNFLNQNYNKKLTLKEIADKFYVSRTALCMSFNKTMHCSVMKYVTELRISAAQKLLDNTDKSIEEIAELCGFSSASYFGLAFKNERGKSPLNYRKR